MRKSTRLVWLVFCSCHIDLHKTLGFRRRRLASQFLHPMLRNTLRSVIVIAFLF